MNKEEFKDIESKEDIVNIVDPMTIPIPSSPPNHKLESIPSPRAVHSPKEHINKQNERAELPIKPSDRRKTAIRHMQNKSIPVLSTVTKNQEKLETYIGTQHNSTLNMGIKIFNIQFQMGRSFLIATGLLASDIQALAQFMFDTLGIYKSVVGKILADITYEQGKLVDLYIDCFQLQDVNFIEAIRMVFGRFTVPAELPAIDIITKSFAKHYFAANPSTPI